MHCGNTQEGNRDLGLFLSDVAALAGLTKRCSLDGLMQGTFILWKTCNAKGAQTKCFTDGDGSVLRDLLIYHNVSDMCNKELKQNYEEQGQVPCAVNKH